MTMIIRIIFFWLWVATANAATFYISTTGSDGADGSIGTPWASPNHAVNAGDIIYVKPGAYTTAWTAFGTVTGTASAFLYCGNNGVRQNFGCTITNLINSLGLIMVNKSYWTVEGFIGTDISTNFSQGCFSVFSASSATDIHHITFRNNVCNGAQGSGLNATLSNGGGSYDYVTFENNIIYNAGQSPNPGFCLSNISMFKPRNVDTAPGVHLLVRGNFSYKSLNASNCSNTANTTWDGEGTILDTFGTVGFSFTGLTLAESNLNIGNGGGCFNTPQAGGAATGIIIIRNNTCYGNIQDPNRLWSQEGEYELDGGRIQSYNNLVQAISATCCASHGPFNLYAIYEHNNTGSTAPSIINIYDYNVGIGISGQNNHVGTGSFTFSSTNIFGTDPTFANPAIPGAPNCTGMTDVPACLRNVDGAGFDVIARFTPTNVAVKGTGNKFFCASNDILGNPWNNNCDQGAIKWSP